MFRFYNKFLIEVNYKSGISRRFWTYKFNAVDGVESLRSMTWVAVSAGQRPLAVGPLDRVESVWQVDYRRGIFGQKPSKGDNK